MAVPPTPPTSVISAITWKKQISDSETLGNPTLKTLGLIVNPIAGMGGRVGLKGTDGEDTHQEALALGAKPLAGKRATEALTVVSRGMPDLTPDLTIITCTGPMGEDVVNACGMSAQVITGIPSDERITTPSDTRRAALEMQKLGVDLLLFAGGDGTARDICDAWSSEPYAAPQMSVLGIPSGVKMHSGVFALTPRRAGEIALKFIGDKAMDVLDAEVMDIDEESFREGRVSATLYGYLKTPADQDGMQSTKAGSLPDDDADLEGIGRQVAADMMDDTLYIIGPGTTTAAISDELGIENTLLGVDVARNGVTLAKDATETTLLELTERAPARIVVSVIGGQGYIFGRGNQQISPSLIRRVGKENITVVATRSKLLGLGGRPLLVDTGDASLDEELCGYTRVITGYQQSHIYRVSC